MIFPAGLLIATLILATGTLAHAQETGLPLPYWQHTMWTGNAGPPASGDHYLLRSRDGYLWVSAFNCLLRFDGVRFTVFDSVTTPALRPKDTGEFLPLFLDRHGVMWISAPGRERITYKDGRFEHALTLDPGVSGPVAEDAQGLIWMRDRRPQHFENGRLIPLPLPAAVPTDIWTIMTDTGAGLWVGTRAHGLWHVSGSGETRQYGTGEIRPLIQSRDGTIWALGLGLKGPAHLEGDRWIHLRMPSDSSAVTTRFAKEDEEGAIWFQTNAQGVIRYRKGVVDAFTSRDGLSDDRVGDIDVDPTGVIWVSTDAGLDRLRPAAFALLDPGHRVTGGGGVSAAPDRGGGMWMTARDGHSVFLLDGGILRGGTSPLSARQFRFGAGAFVSLLDASPRGGVWLKPYASDLLYLRADGTRQTFGAGDGLTATRINGGLETRDGALWLELLGGFGRLRNGRYRPVSIDSVMSPHANAYIEDARGRLWFAWDDQPILAVFSGDSVVGHVTVPIQHVDHFALEGGDTLWAASEYGLVRIIGAAVVQVRVPSLERVLAPNVSIAIAQGSLWISSSGGIARIRLDELHRAAHGDSTRIAPQVFDALDGLETAHAANMMWQSVVVGRDGRVWVNTAAGLALASPAPATGVRAPGRVLIEEIMIDGTRVTDGATTSPKPGRLDIHFTATGLELPERARLQYRLTGVDKDWVNAGLPRTASYNHLRPGNYTFTVRALNESGFASGSEPMIRLRVPPAWDQAWWFFALLATAIAATAGGGATLWQRRRSRLVADRARARFDDLLAERNRQYEATLTERARIAQELHDTLLQGFAGVTLQLKAAQLALPEQPDVAAETLDRVQRLARESLREARERVWDLRDSELDSGDLPRLLETVARERTAGTGIAIGISCDGPSRPLARPAADAAFRIGREAIANAVRHAAPRRIEIHVSYGATLFRLEVRDDGRGFMPEEAEEARRLGHLGLSGARERAARLGGECKVLRRPEGGTLVVVELPLVELPTQ